VVDHQARSVLAGPIHALKNKHPKPQKNNLRLFFVRLFLLRLDRHVSPSWHTQVRFFLFLSHIMHAFFSVCQPLAFVIVCLNPSPLPILSRRISSTSSPIFFVCCKLALCASNHILDPLNTSSYHISQFSCMLLDVVSVFVVPLIISLTALEHSPLPLFSTSSFFLTRRIELVCIFLS